MIEIIPKKAPHLSSLLNFLFYFSLILLIAVIIAIFVFNSSIKNSKKTLEELEKSLAQSKTTERIDLENEVLSFQKKIKDFSLIAEQHLETSKVFEVLEKNCHPKVWFPQFNLNTGESKITLSGEAESFEVLGQQISLFKEADFINSVNLESTSMTKEGNVIFSLSILINPNVFK